MANKLNIFAQGDSICLESPVIFRNSEKPITNVVIEVTVPDGTSIVSAEVFYVNQPDPLRNGVQIVSVLNGNNIEIPLVPKTDFGVNVCFLIEDESALCSGDKTPVLTLVKDCDINPGNNTQPSCLEGILCCELAKCGGRFTIASPNNTLQVVLNGMTYELEVEHTVNGDGSITLNDGTVIPAQTPETITDLSVELVNDELIVTYNNEDASNVIPNIDLSQYSNITYTIDDSHLGVDGIVDLVDSNGSVVGQINLCDPACPTITALAVGDTVNATTCGTIFGSVSTNDTPCASGNSIWKLIPGTEINGTVLMGANGEYAFFPDGDCSMDGGFSYSIECDDGNTYSSTVTITFPVPVGADAVDDSFAGPNGGTPIPINVALNDTTCTGAVTTFQVNNQSPDGMVIMGSNGSGFFVPFSPTFEGTTTFTYDILCDGIVADTATGTIIVVQASANDDFLIGLTSTVTGPLDGTANDTPCTLPAITTYEWDTNPPYNGAPAGASGGFGGAFDGTPANFDYTPPGGNFCGTDYVKYQQFCDTGGGPILFSEATIFIYVSCASPSADSFVSNTIDGQISGLASDNDLPCSFGAITSYHLVSDPTANGTGLSEPTNESDITIIEWDQSNGQVLAQSSNGFVGTASANYFIRCTHPTTGQTHDTGPSQIEFTIDPFFPIANIQVAPQSTESSTFDINLGAYLDQSGTFTTVDNGDLLKITIPEIGVDVELIVGQDPSTPAGFQNDVGSTSWNDIVNSSTGITTLLPGQLLTSSYSFVFDKRAFAISQGLAGDLIGVGKGIDYTWNNQLTDVSSGLVNLSTDNMPTLYGMTEVYVGGSRPTSTNCPAGSFNHRSAFLYRDTYEGDMNVITDWTISAQTATPVASGPLVPFTPIPDSTNNFLAACAQNLASPAENLVVWSIDANTANQFYRNALVGQTITYRWDNGSSPEFHVSRTAIRPVDNHGDVSTRTIDSYRHSIRSYSGVRDANPDVSRVEVVNTAVGDPLGTPGAYVDTVPLNPGTSNSQTINATAGFTFPSDGVFNMKHSIVDVNGGEESFAETVMLVYSF